MNSILVFVILAILSLMTQQHIPENRYRSLHHKYAIGLIAAVNRSGAFNR